MTPIPPHTHTHTHTSTHTHSARTHTLTHTHSMNNKSSSLMLVYHTRWKHQSVWHLKNSCSCIKNNYQSEEPNISYSKIQCTIITCSVAFILQSALIHCACCVIFSCFFVIYRLFFKINFLKKNLSEILSEFQQLRSRSSQVFVRPDFDLSHLQRLKQTHGGIQKQTQMVESLSCFLTLKAPITTIFVYFVSAVVFLKPFRQTV